jgi:hypothetical protein
MARKSATPLTPSQLKEFRHKIAILNKKGLLSKTNAKSAKPTWIRGGKRLDKVVADYDDVLSGKADAIKVAPAQLKQYKKAGYETLKDRVIIPHSATETASITPKGTIKVRESKGIQRVEIPIPFHNLEQFVHDGIKQGEQLDTLKGGKHRVWAYKFFGHNSYATYSNLDLLFAELAEGTASGLNLMDKAQESTWKQQNEIYQNLTLFSLSPPSIWPHRDIGKRPAATPAARARYRKRIKGTAVGERAAHRNAQDQARHRAKLKGAKLAEYKRKAKKRAKKSRKRK